MYNRRPKYKIGEQVIFTSKTVSSPFTTNKIYFIKKITDYSSEYTPGSGRSPYKGNMFEYTIIRDDGLEGLWWETELDENFKSKSELRKEKIIKLNENQH